MGRWNKEEPEGQANKASMAWFSYEEARLGREAYIQSEGRAGAKRAGVKQAGEEGNSGVTRAIGKQEFKLNGYYMYKLLN